MAQDSKRSLTKKGSKPGSRRHVSKIAKGLQSADYLFTVLENPKVGPKYPKIKEGTLLVFLTPIVANIKKCFEIFSENNVSITFSENVLKHQKIEGARSGEKVIRKSLTMPSVSPGIVCYTEKRGKTSLVQFARPNDSI